MSRGGNEEEDFTAKSHNAILPQKELGVNGRLGFGAHSFGLDANHPSCNWLQAHLFLDCELVQPSLKEEALVSTVPILAHFFETLVCIMGTRNPS